MIGSAVHNVGTGASPSGFELPGFALSSAQESLFFLEQINPGTALFNMPEGWRFTGALDGPAFYRSLEFMVARHESLRTVFLMEEGHPRQLILPAGAPPIERRDLSGAANPEGAAREMLQQEARKPFDLRRGPLWRVLLLQVDRADHFLLLNMHHIISDAWSFGIFMKELAALYGAFTRGLPSPLRELPVQYVDFAAWQRESLSVGIFTEQLNYWKERLAQPLPQLALPLDRPRRTPETARGETRFFSIPKALAEDLKRLSQREEATLFMTVLAGFATLLHRYTGERDVVIGSPLSGRDRVETEGLIGFFINTHALRINLDGDPSFEELLKRVKETTLGAYAHQAVPFEQIVRAIQPERTSAPQSMFQVVFALQTAFTEQWEMPGLQTTRIELETGTAKFDWTVLLTETSDDLSMRFEYKPDLFDSSTIEGTARHFEALLKSIAASPATPISKLSLLNRTERQELLIDWNNTDTAYEREQTIHQVFEARAKEAPTAIALSWDGREMTYADVNARANQLARRLKLCGVGRGAPVGVCLPRSADLVIALLAILKAGGGYVPLESGYPQERLAFMIKDSGVKLILTSEPLNLKTKVQEIMVASKGTEDDAGPDNLDEELRPEQVAYIIYTSGSTGTPKGTIIPHRAVVRLVRNTNYIEIHREDRLLQLAPFSFDASTFEIWGALLNGATLVIPAPDTPSLEALGRTIEQEKISILWLTSGLFHQMVDSQLNRLQGLRCLLAGGDALSVPHITKARQALKGALINGYGPTENTTFSCCYAVPLGWEGTAASVPIGKPISNTRVYVLDCNLEPVPVGVPGELYAGGDGLAIGYLNEPELTAEKFIPSPFHDFGRERLYRTGDRVRWLSNGNLEFLGRLDHQVKIRGFRVEPGEIEAVVIQFAGIREAAVVPFMPANGIRVLVCYLVPEAGSEISNETLRRFLQTQLPPYLVPSHFVQLEALPLTPNGKLDRRALPGPDTAVRSPMASRIAPRTLIEKTLASIWTDLLGVAPIGIHDNFFHLGGHSLLATQVISRVAKTCNAEIPVRALFELPTIAELAPAVARAQNRNPDADQPIPRRNGASNTEKLLARLEEFSESELEQALNGPLFKQASHEHDGQS